MIITGKMNIEQKICHFCASSSNQLNFHLNCHHIICVNCAPQNTNTCNCIICGKLTPVTSLQFILAHQEFGKYFSSNVITDWKLACNKLELNFTILLSDKQALIKKITEMEGKQKQLEIELNFLKQQNHSLQQAISNYEKPSLFMSIGNDKTESLFKSLQTQTPSTSNQLKSSFERFNINSVKSTTSTGKTIQKGKSFQIGSIEKKKAVVHPSPSGISIQSSSRLIQRITPVQRRESEDPFPVRKRSHFLKF